MSLVIEVLYTPGCCFFEETVESIERLCAEHNITAKLEKVLIDNWEKAIEYSFIGSPSIRINGLDIDPRVRRASAEGFT